MTNLGKGFMNKMSPLFLVFIAGMGLSSSALAVGTQQQGGDDVGTQKFANGTGCTLDSECTSNYCDLINGSVCALKSNGMSCSAANECASSYCDPNSQCATNPSPGGNNGEIRGGSGAGCTSSADCQSGFSCDTNTIPNSCQPPSGGGGSGSQGDCWTGDARPTATLNPPLAANDRILKLKLDGEYQNVKKVEVRLRKLKRGCDYFGGVMPAATAAGVNRTVAECDNITLNAEETHASFEPAAQSGNNLEFFCRLRMNRNIAGLGPGKYIVRVFGLSESGASVSSTDKGNFMVRAKPKPAIYYGWEKGAASTPINQIKACSDTTPLPATSLYAQTVDDPFLITSVKLSNTGTAFKMDNPTGAEIVTRKLFYTYGYSGYGANQDWIPKNSSFPLPPPANKPFLSGHLEANSTHHLELDVESEGWTSAQKAHLLLSVPAQSTVRTIASVSAANPVKKTADTSISADIRGICSDNPSGVSFTVSNLMPARPRTVTPFNQTCRETTGYGLDYRTWTCGSNANYTSIPCTQWLVPGSGAASCSATTDQPGDSMRAVASVNWTPSVPVNHADFTLANKSPACLLARGAYFYRDDSKIPAPLDSKVPTQVFLNDAPNNSTPYSGNWFQLQNGIAGTQPVYCENSGGWYGWGNCTKDYSILASQIQPGAVQTTTLETTGSDTSANSKQYAGSTSAYEVTSPDRFTVTVTGTIPGGGGSCSGGDTLDDKVYSLSSAQDNFATTVDFQSDPGLGLAMSPPVAPVNIPALGPKSKLLNVTLFGTYRYFPAWENYNSCTIAPQTGGAKIYMFFCNGTQSPGCSGAWQQTPSGGFNISGASNMNALPFSTDLTTDIKKMSEMDGVLPAGKGWFYVEQSAGQNGSVLFDFAAVRVVRCKSP
jgi:hypothetical protein